jgi:peptide/nickel transport system permease protein
MAIRALSSRAEAAGSPDRLAEATGIRRFGRALLRNRKATAGAVILLVISLVAAFPGLIAHENPQAAIYGQNLGPSAGHLLGTTQTGQDVFSQLIYGTRLTLIITVVVSAIATVISMIIGVTSAYVGGMADRSLSLLTDVFLIVPVLPLLIVLASYLPPGPTTMILVLCLTCWAFQARQLRSQELSLRNRDFLMAARVRGERSAYIILMEMVPTMIPLLAASFLGVAVYVVGFAAGLQFLGLGNGGELTWGTILYYAQENGALESGNAWWELAPGAAVALLGAGFALLNYVFDEIGNPALRPARSPRRKRADRVASETAGDRSPAQVLAVRDLSASFVTERATVRAVQEVGFDLRAGEFVSVVGESGCGKSTLLFAIAQLLAPPGIITGGSVVFNGLSLVGLGNRQLAAIRWKNMSVVMQSAMNALNPVKSIGAQFSDAMRAHGVRSKQEIADRSADVLKMVGIDSVHLKSYPHQLSGGMRQRSMIAMAMLFAPDLVIMDEPTSALDVVAQRSLMMQVKDLQKRLGFAVIFVTHDMSLVRHFSDRVMVMYAGQLAELGETSSMFDAPMHPYSIGLMDAFPSIRGPRLPLTGIPGSPPDLARPSAGCQFAPRCPKVMPRCETDKPGLYRAADREVRCFLYENGTGDA